MSPRLVSRRAPASPGTVNPITITIATIPRIRPASDFVQHTDSPPLISVPDADTTDLGGASVPVSRLVFKTSVGPEEGPWWVRLPCISAEDM